MTTPQQIKAEIRELKREMKQRGIRVISCFNGGLDSETRRFNTRLFELKTKLRLCDPATL